MVIKKLMDIAREEQTELIVMGLSGSVAKTLQALAVLREVPEKQVVSTLDEARQARKTSSAVDDNELAVDSRSG